MVKEIRVRERERDENLGIIKKEINFPRNYSIETPIKTFTAPTRDWRDYENERLDLLEVNEINRRYDLNTLIDLAVKGSTYQRDIQRKFVPDKLNIFIPHLRIQKIPDDKILRTFSHFIYTVSDLSVVLPTVDSAFLKTPKSPEHKTKTWNKKLINDYITIIKKIIYEINTIGNGKSFIGMIPLMPITFIRPLLNLYQEQGINSFVIDAGTRDILGASEFEFRTILSEINSEIVPLHQSLIFASNLGYGQFKRNWTLADDFLSIFAYVDILGNTFKTRGFQPDPTKDYMPRAKVFSRENYSYIMTSFNYAEQILNMPGLNRVKLRAYNENQQQRETNTLSQLIGEIDMSNYLLQKDAILQEPQKFERLRGISRGIEN